MYMHVHEQHVRNIMKLIIKIIILVIFHVANCRTYVALHVCRQLNAFISLANNMYNSYAAMQVPLSKIYT